MKKIALLLTATVLLFSACSKERLTPKEPAYPNITINASLPDITELHANPQIAPQVGIVEGSTDYDAGEKYYWENGDKIIFIIDEMLIAFRATGIPQGEKPQSAAFQYFIGGLPTQNGTYPIRAYCDGAWTSINQDLAMAMPWTGYGQNGSSTSENTQSMSNMIADGYLTVEDNTYTVSNLTFKQLNTMLRFSIWDASTVQELTIRMLFITKEGTTTPLFNQKAQLPRNSTSYTSQSEPLSYLYLSVGNGVFNQANINGEKRIFDVYALCLPTNGYTADDDYFTITAFYQDKDKVGYTSVHKIKCSEVDFLKTGFKENMRYLFRLKVDDSNLAKLKYKPGDYYPFVSYPEHSEGMVFYVDPASGNDTDGYAKGKVISWFTSGFSSYDLPTYMPPLDYHIPSIEEAKILAAAYCGVSYSTASWTNGQMDNWNSYATARALFQSRFSKLHQQPDINRTFWTSAEGSSENTIQTISYTTGTFGSAAKTSSNYFLFIKDF